MKQFLKLLMIAAMLLSFSSASAYDFEVDGIYYDIESLPELTCCISGGNPELTSIALPSSITLNGRVLKVLRVKENAWKGNKTLTSVSLSEGIDSIAPSAFEECVNLKSLNLGSVKGIAEKAFYRCKQLTEIRLPGSLIRVGNEAFALDYISNSADYISTKITFSEGDGYLFAPSNSTIGKNGIFNYRNASEIILNRDIRNFGDAWGNDSKRQVSIGELVTCFPSYLGQYMTECDMSSTNIKIIDDHAFGSSLKQITLPAKLDSIGSYAFSNSNIKEIIFPQSLRAIGKSAFYNCEKLKNPILPSHLEYMGNNAFGDCQAITDITIPGSLTIIPNEAFDYCRYLKSVDIKEGVEVIGERAFRSCYDLMSLNLPSSLKTIETYAFMYCKSLESFTIPSTLQMIGANVFYDCSKLSKLIFEESDTPLYFKSSETDSKTIGQRGWYDSEEEAYQHPYVWVCNLKSPFILDNLTEVVLNRTLQPAPIDEYTSDENPGELPFGFRVENYTYSHLLYVANSNIEALTIGDISINPFTIPEPLIQEWVKYKKGYGRQYQTNYKATYNFSPSVYPANLSKLKVINCKLAEPPVLDADFPTGVYISATLNVPVGSKQAYENAPYWKNFWGIQESEFSGINEIKRPTSDIYVVYNLQGMFVLRTMDLESLHRLPAGIYIVNGNKIAIR